MSSVRCCDKCGTIFSEREEGWETYTAKRMVRGKETRERYSESVALDVCPSCAMGDFETSVVTPQLPSRSSTT
jgi:hypothetical protein